MKPALKISLTIILILSGLLGYGQVRVTGHVSAEVVESISASCNSNIDMSLNSQEIKQFNLGSFSISGKAMSTCMVVIDNARISNNKGESFTIQTSATGAVESLTADQNGNQKLNLVAGTDELLANGNYQGIYVVTFAYN